MTMEMLWRVDIARMPDAPDPDDNVRFFTKEERAWEWIDLSAVDDTTIQAVSRPYLFRPS